MKNFRRTHAAAVAAVLIAGSALAPSANAQKCFWSDYDAGGNGIQNLPIPVSGVPTLLNATKTHDVAIDTANQVLYWTDNQLGVGYVMRGLAVGGPGTIVAAVNGSAWKVGYIKDNFNDEWVYWTDIFANDLVYRRNITTGAVAQVLPVRSVFGIALDKRTNQQKLYTVDPTTSFVVKTDLAGIGGPFSTTAWDVGTLIQVDGMCIDTVHNRLWAVGMTEVSHPGPTRSWVKYMNLSSGVIVPFLTSPLGQGDPVGVLDSFILADIAYDCVGDEVYWTSYDFNTLKSTIRKSTMGGVWSIYYTPPGAYLGRFEGLAIDSNAPCSQYNQICPGHTGITGLSCPCGNVSTTDPIAGCVSSLGMGAVMGATGNPSVASDSFVLHVDSMPNGPGLYFQGSMPQNSGDGVALGDGLLCVGGAITRLGVKFATGGGSSFPLPGIDLPISVQAGIVAGDTRYYQAWYRDSAVAFCTAGTYNLSNGMKVEWGP